MNQIITEQLDRFKTGDFSGYESFYNETVQTVYTMLVTIVQDVNVATSLVPQVYDKIYQNVTTLAQTEGFYQWTAKFVNEEAMQYLKNNGLTGSNMPTNLEETEQFYDYAAEDEALMITEDVVEDTTFVQNLQEIVSLLSPIEKIVFQDYYYFGTGIVQIAAKTGCSDADIRHMLSRTRTSILQAIEKSTLPEAYRNVNIRKYRLADAPWLWIAYQNFLGYKLGFDTVSVGGFLFGILGQAAGGLAVGGEGAVGAGMTAAAGAGGAIGTGSAAGAGGAIGTGSAAGAGGAIGTGGAAASVGGSAAAGILGTIGGKIALGVIGVAVAASIGVGVHHVIAGQDEKTETTVITTEQQAQNEEPTADETETREETEETTEATTETTEETTEATTEATAEALTDVEQYNEILAAEKQINPEHGVYICEDVNGDGVDELIIGSFVMYQAGGNFWTDVKSVYTIKDGNVQQIYQKPCEVLYQAVKEEPYFHTVCEPYGIIEIRTAGTTEPVPTVNSRAYYMYEDGNLRFDHADIQIWRSGYDSTYYTVTSEEAYKALDIANESDMSVIISQVEENPDEFPLCPSDHVDSTEWQKYAWKSLDEEKCEMEMWNENFSFMDEDGKF